MAFHKPSQVNVKTSPLPSPIGSISRKGSFVFVSHSGLMPKAIKFLGEYFLRKENNLFQNMGRIMKQTNKQKTGSFFLVKSFA